MDFATIRKVLVEHGWKAKDDSVTAPSGGIWLDPVQLDRAGACELYAAFARRKEQATRSRELESADEYGQAMQALAAGDDAVSLLRARHERFKVLVSEWLRTHDMLVTSWDFSQPSLRGSGRHPRGGVGAIEVVHEEGDRWEVFAFHWIDDVKTRRRRSWSQRWRGSACDPAMLMALEEAWKQLMETHPEDAYVHGAIESGGRGEVIDHLQDVWMTSLPNLREGAG
jgi:hypothetical protein